MDSGDKRRTSAGESGLYRNVRHPVYLGVLPSAIADPLISSTYMKNLAAEEKSTTNGIRMTFMQGGNVVGPWLGGQLMEKVSLGFPALLGGGIYAVTAVLTLILLKRVNSGARVEE